MIIDSHTHFYDPFRPQGVPWPDQSTEAAIFRTVLPENHREVAAPAGVGGTVVTAASVWLEDNQWLLDLAEADPWIVGVVGYIPEDDDFAKNVDRFASNLLWRGYRAGAAFVDNTDGGAVERAAKIAEYDLQVDICHTKEHPEMVCRVARQVPQLRWVINHCGEPTITGGAPDAVWTDYISAVSSESQVFCKLSGLVEYSQIQPAPGELEYYLPILEFLWDAFGEDRLIYGSNWPVCDMHSNHEQVMSIASTFVGSKGGDRALEKLWWKNAKRAYKYIDRH